MSKDEIKMHLHEFIENNNIQMPMREMTEEYADKSFRELLELDTRDVIKTGECFTRYEYEWWQQPSFYLDGTRIGNDSSNYFHQESRWMADSINSPSPYRSWNIRKFRDGLLNSLWTLKVDHVDMNVMRSCLGLRKYIASQFRPSAAKTIYQFFNSKHVLDFSSGWGDRYAGFYASDALTYTGVDPNARLYEGYAKQKEFYKRISGIDKPTNFIEGCAEDQKYDRKFDTIFTSIPYWNVERYTQEKNQSWQRYKKLDVWLDEFLFKSLTNAWGALAYNGVLAMNLSDVYSNHRINQLCDPMCSFIKKLPNSKFEGIIGYRMSKRPGSVSDQYGIFIEPLWIFRKETDVKKRNSKNN